MTNLIPAKLAVLRAMMVAATAAAIACGDGGGYGSPGGPSTPAGGGAAPTATIEAPMTPAVSPGAAGQQVDITMAGIQFDKKTITVQGGTVTVTAKNTDDGIRHNFSVYADSSVEESLGKTDICEGPCTDSVTLELGAGQYFFWCDVHRSRMTGTLVVE